MKNKILFFFLLSLLFLGACQKDQVLPPEPPPEPKPDSGVIIIKFSPLPENVERLSVYKCVIFDRKDGLSIRSLSFEEMDNMSPPQYIWGIDRKVMKEYKNKPVGFLFIACRIYAPNPDLGCFGMEVEDTFILKAWPEINQVYIDIPPISYP